MTRRHSRSRRSKETPGWMWMLLGLTMGLFVAGYIYLSDVRAPSMARQTRASEPASASTPEGGVAASRPEARQQASASARTQTAAQPATARAPAAQASTASPSTRQTSTASAASASQASSAQTSAPERESAARTTGPRFQFYENLPNSEVIVPEPTPTARAARTATAAAPTAVRAPEPATIEEPGAYMLQVGSFSSPADADRRKASIALLGYESQIQQATVNGTLVHRVLVGPITDLTALDVARRRFREQNFDTLVLKAAK